MPTTEFQLTLDRRELASILAGLRLLAWAHGPDARILPYSVCAMIDESCAPGTIDPLTDVELLRLVRRLS